MAERDHNDHINHKVRHTMAPPCLCQAPVTGCSVKMKMGKSQADVKPNKNLTRTQLKMSILMQSLDYRSHLSVKLVQNQTPNQLQAR